MKNSMALAQKPSICHASRAKAISSSERCRRWRQATVRPAAVVSIACQMPPAKFDVTTLKVDVTTLKATVHRVESRMDREDADPRRLQEDEAVFRRRLDELEARLRVLEEHLPRD